ncbi:MAG: isocitrate/isopropylmalate dehydrogenase family protein [Dehalococcoidia bacterium]|nr:isocitrate/isopropylmalate dehydrogenase family protein [Dehalococcoidia bacterium]
MQYNVTLIPGDGVGPEVTEATRRVLEATGIKFKWEMGLVGQEAQDKLGTPLPDSVLESIRKNKLALKGPVTTPIGYGFRSVNVRLRQVLNLYCCLRPCKIYPGVPTKYQGVDLVIVRENTEDLYIGIEFENGTPGRDKLLRLVAETSGEKLGKDTGISLKVISESATRRIMKYAFEYARANGRKKVCAVHKANILKFSDGLFLNTSREVAKEYPDIEFEDMLIDTLCMRLVVTPERFDIIVLPNLYGDIISELCAGVIGGLGVAPSANLGDGIAVFEPTHGSAPQYAGKNMVNPMAMMLSAVSMLRYLGEKAAGDRIESAVSRVIEEGACITYDLARGRPDCIPMGTTQVTDAIIETMKR